MKKAAAYIKRTAFFICLVKSEALRRPLLNSKVWTIGLFLFCAAIFGGQANAEQGTVEIPCTVHTVGYQQDEGAYTNLLTAINGNDAGSPFYSVANYDNTAIQIITRSYVDCDFSFSGLPLGLGLMTFLDTSKFNYSITWSPNACDGTDCRTLQLYNFDSTFAGTQASDYGRMKPSIGKIGIREASANMANGSTQMDLTTNNRSWAATAWASGRNAVSFAIKGLMDNGGSGDSDSAPIITWSNNQNYWLINDFSLTLDYSYTPESGGPNTIGSSGLNISDNWFCCSGSCGYPISMAPQLGWWGIGSSTSRVLYYSLDNATSTNSINLTNISNAIINIASSTPNGYHNLNLQLYLEGNLVATSTQRIQIVSGPGCYSTNPDQFNAFCSEPCAGLATTTDPLNLDNLRCGLQQFGCWLVVPTPDSISYIMGQFNGLTANFPLAPFSRMYDNLNVMATGTQAIAPGTIAVPFYSSSTGHYISQNYSLGSSTAITNNGFQKFRRFEVILIWCLLAAGPTIFVLWRLIMPI